MHLRPYQLADKADCIRIFSGNAPTYFAPHEQAEFDQFLDEPECTYFVVVDAGQVIGCGGYYIDTIQQISALCWGMVANEQQHRGVGRYLLLQRLKAIAQNEAVEAVLIDTSQHTAPFFEKFGFVTQKIVEHGYSDDLHEYDMVLTLDDERRHWIKEKAAML